MACRGDWYNAKVTTAILASNLDEGKEYMVEAFGRAFAKGIRKPELFPVFVENKFKRPCGTGTASGPLRQPDSELLRVSQSP